MNTHAWKFIFKYTIISILLFYIILSHLKFFWLFATIIIIFLLIIDYKTSYENVKYIINRFNIEKTIYKSTPVQSTTLEQLKFGDFFQQDFRDKNTKIDISQIKTIRIISYNIERGHKLDGIIEDLRKYDSEIICLQEVETNCKYNNYKDTGIEIAKALKMNYMFSCQYNCVCRMGLQGNAILTKFDFSKVYSFIIPCGCYHGFHKKVHNTAVVSIDIPKRKKFFVYCTHFDPWTGIIGRSLQFSRIMEDVYKQFQFSKEYNFIITGDFNTVCSGINRLNPLQNADYMRWKTIGSSEAEWFEKCWFNNELHALKELVNVGINEDLIKFVGNNFMDPFDKKMDTTWKLKGIYEAKLDWIIMNKSLKCADKKVVYTNNSDHHFIQVTVQI